MTTPAETRAQLEAAQAQLRDRAANRPVERQRPPREVRAQFIADGVRQVNPHNNR